MVIVTFPTGRESLSPVGIQIVRGCVALDVGNFGDGTGASPFASHSPMIRSYSAGSDCLSPKPNFAADANSARFDRWWRICGNDARLWHDSTNFLQRTSGANRVKTGSKPAHWRESCRNRVPNTKWYAAPMPCQLTSCVLNGRCRT